MDYIFFYESPLGRITLASDGKFLTGLWFEGQKYFGYTLGKNPQYKILPIFSETSEWLDCYFSGHDPGVVPQIKVNASPFRKLVWDILLDIPYGSLSTYSDVACLAAKYLGKSSMSAQAVGGAVGHNPISIIIPCHRIVAKNGSLTGYAGGIDKKAKLLELEKADFACMFK